MTNPTPNTSDSEQPDAVGTIPDTQEAAVSQKDIGFRVICMAFAVALVLFLGPLVAYHFSDLNLPDALPTEELSTWEIDRAYSDVRYQKVAVNGDRGTPLWRKAYADALQRYASSFDFEDECSSNGFLKELPTNSSMPCIAAGDIRVVGLPGSTLSYFKEDDFRGTSIRLDVLQQDVHAENYVDIDALTKALEDRVNQRHEAQLAELKAATESALELLRQNSLKVPDFRPSVPAYVDPELGALEE